MLQKHTKINKKQPKHLIVTLSKKIIKNCFHLNTLSLSVVKKI